MEKIRKNYEHIYPAGPTYIRGIRTGDTLYISGTTANDSIVEDNTMSQLRVILDRIIKIVEAEGGTPSDIVSMTTYIKDSKMDEFWPIRGEQIEIWSEYFSGDWPTNSYVGVASLAVPNLLVEISTIVVFD